MRIGLAIAGLAIMICFDAPSSHAQIYGNAPWCAVMEIGAGEVQRDCDYDSLRDCTQSVIAGNRGFCQINPYYAAPPDHVVHRGAHWRHRRPYH
ncbi:MAG: DUF3551 domain-containing protein [Xanthobacteraceae bacterium]